MKRIHMINLEKTTVSIAKNMPAQARGITKAKAVLQIWFRKLTL